MLVPLRSDTTTAIPSSSVSIAGEDPRPALLVREYLLQSSPPRLVKGGGRTQSSGLNPTPSSDENDCNTGANIVGWREAGSGKSEAGRLELLEDYQPLSCHLH